MTKIHSNNKIVIKKKSLKQIKGGASSTSKLLEGSLEPIQVQFFQLNTVEPGGAYKVFTMYLKDVTVNLDNINGYNLYGIIIKIERELHNSAWSLVKRLIDSNKIEEGKYINIFDIKFLRDNKLGLVWQFSLSLLPVLSLYSKYLNEKFTNFEWWGNGENGQASIFFKCKEVSRVYNASRYYKIHISVDQKFMLDTVEKLNKILCNYKDLFIMGKMPMPQFTPFYSMQDIVAQKHLKWNCGSGAGNIVLYPNEIYDEQIDLFKIELDKFIKEWDEIGGNNYGREDNNLWFNHNISKSLYLGYGSYSAKKCDEMEKMINLYKKKNLYHNQLEYVKDIKDKSNFKISTTLQNEKNKFCNNKDKYSEEQSSIISKCLSKNYNISFDDLCNNEPNMKDVWIDKDMPPENEIIFDNECYKTLDLNQFPPHPPPMPMEPDPSSPPLSSAIAESFSDEEMKATERTAVQQSAPATTFSKAALEATERTAVQQSAPETTFSKAALEATKRMAVRQSAPETTFSKVALEATKRMAVKQSAPATTFSNAALEATKRMADQQSAPGGKKNRNSIKSRKSLKSLLSRKIKKGMKLKKN